jgi:signal peptidase I
MRVRSVVLTTGAVLGSVCLLLALAGVLLDVRTLVFRSGSMGPEIPAGSVGLASSVAAAELAKGDVVSVIDSEGVRVTHRIVAIDGTGAKRELTLRGDANAAPDAETYVVKKADRLFWSVPGVGYVIAWLGSPVGLFTLGGVAVGFLVLGFGSTRPQSRGGGRRRALATVAAAGAAVFLAGPATLGTWASYDDSSTVTAGTFQAPTVDRVDSVTCSASGANATFAWPEKDPRYDYEIVLWRDATTDVLVSTNQVTGSGLSRQYNNDNDFGLSGGLIGSNQTHFFYAQVRSWLSGTSSPNRWQSADVRQSTLRVRIQISCTIILLCTVGNPTCVA